MVSILIDFLESHNYYNSVPNKFRYNKFGNINYTYNENYKLLKYLNINITQELDITTTESNFVLLKKEKRKK